MNIVIFEDQNFDNFYPFSINHSPFEIRIGTTKNLDRISNFDLKPGFFLYQEKLF